MMSITMRSAIPAVIALSAAAIYAQPASAKEYFKGYSWNKFAPATSSATTAPRVPTEKPIGTADSPCSTYLTKWKTTGDNIWRGRWYACVYGGN